MRNHLINTDFNKEIIIYYVGDKLASKSNRETIINLKYNKVQTY